MSDTETDPRLTRQGVHEQVAELLGEEPGDVGGTDDLIDLGLDSIRVMTLVGLWRKRGVDVSFEDLAESPTLDAWWSLLSSRSGGAAGTVEAADG